MKVVLFFITIGFYTWLAPPAQAQGGAISFRDTIAAYHQERILVNANGAILLGTGGLINTAAGTIGAIAATQPDTRYFYQTGIAFGLVQTAFSGYWLLQCRHQSKTHYGSTQAYNLYSGNKNHLLATMGISALTAGYGAYLTSKAKTAGDQQDLYRGAGTAMALQGVFMLLFSNITYAKHQKSDKKWQRIMSEMQFTGNGFSYTLGY